MVERNFVEGKHAPICKFAGNSVCLEKDCWCEGDIWVHSIKVDLNTGMCSECIRVIEAYEERICCAKEKE